MKTALRLVTLAPGSPADIAAVEQVMAAAFDPRFGEAWTRGQCLGIMAMPGVWLTLAQRDGETVGFSLARRILDEAELLLLATAPLHRRHGVAAALLRAMIEDCAARGVQRLHLEVREGNDAVHLYAAHGFAKVGERRDYYRGNTGGTFDAHSYARTIG